MNHPAPPSALPSALLFDLDGTLIDSRRDIAEACNAALEAHGRAALPFERIAAMVGDGARALVARAFGVAEGDPLTEEGLATFRERYLSHPCVHTTLLPGVRAVLEDAETLGVPCALVTNKPRDVTLRVLEELSVARFFRALWGGGDGPLKPSPAGLQAVMGTLGVSPARCWMVGDGPQDVSAGRAAGCFTVGVPGIAAREELLASRPDRVCESFVELRALLLAAR